MDRNTACVIFGTVLGVIAATLNIYGIDTPWLWIGMFLCVVCVL